MNIFNVTEYTSQIDFKNIASKRNVFQLSNFHFITPLPNTYEYDRIIHWLNCVSVYSFERKKSLYIYFQNNINQEYLFSSVFLSPPRSLFHLFGLTSLSFFLCFIIIITESNEFVLSGKKQLTMQYHSKARSKSAMHRSGTSITIGRKVINVFS